MAGAGLVIEVIYEDLEAKVTALSALEPHLSADAIVATNTSSLSVTALAGRHKRPERVVGMHFFNPATVLPLVEVVSGHVTAPEVAQTRIHRYRRSGLSRSTWPAMTSLPAQSLNIESNCAASGTGFTRRCGQSLPHTNRSGLASIIFC